MPASIRAQAVSLVVVLLCVPALTRVHQHFDSTNSRPTASFRKSFDSPPEKAGGSSALVMMVARTPLESDPPPAPRVSPAPPVLPLGSFEESSPDGLRAPPRI